MAVPLEVRKLFERELAARGVAVQEVAEDGSYVLTTAHGTNSITLENIAREYQRDGDESAIGRFVDTILAAGQPIPDTWDGARPRIRWAIESIDLDLGDSLLDQVSDQTRVGPVYVSADETQIAYITPEVLERWDVTHATVMSAAAVNMAELLAQVSIHVEEVGEHRLGMFASEDDFPGRAFKASLLLCPGLRDLVEPVLGWPVYAVMPSRDFVYFVPHDDSDLLPRLGPTVVREYHQSGYPVSMEVFEITDQGIRAISEFQAPEGVDPLDAADGMKTILYRGGVVSFRIPSHWEEEYEDEGGARFFDEDGAGTLHLNVITFQSKSLVSDDTPTEMLEMRSASVEGEVVTRDDGNAILHYRNDTEEDGEDLAIWYWEVANAVPPNHARIALFSFAVEAESAEDDEVRQTLAMLGAEIGRCAFAESLGE